MIGLELLIKLSLAFGFLSVGISLSVISTMSSGVVPFWPVALETTTEAKERPSMTGEYGTPASSSKVGAMSMDRTGIVTFCFAVIFGPRIQNGTSKRKFLFNRMCHIY